MMQQGSGSPAPAIRPSSVNGKVLRIGGALVIAAATLGATAAFQRKLPAQASSPAGIHVEKNSVTLESDAPQWSAIKTGTVQAPKERWTDAFPARFRVDESAASRVGSPLAGRVTAVSIEMGMPVKAGQPLFTV
ncbi:MAG TPA: biotin/lipoyl-binding protein, partial [Polyangiaceae bacterium]|nr:biotin/lipoyl-binding protein [Polyangiaceae bacterium]